MTTNPPKHPNTGPSEARLRIGHGYDLHRLDELAPNGQGRPFMLGGIQIPASRGPVGHSDADALLHAVTDALLGAIGEPDIGQLFPDSDPRHESQDSSVFVKEALRRVMSRGFGIVNLDATVVCEHPKIGPHREAIIAKIAGLLGVDTGVVNVKAKTHEGVDAVGEGRAIEVHCVVLLAAEG
ncbi:MAG: 2-C-methyl-D-erythritol 2,4-cyclodiphosphate synthase [Phycisphaerales bacterium]|nr:2-C-methyl-D-erythritol 2,4-cyclodiphosphate synthase [Phycisphaerales bacterium]